MRSASSITPKTELGEALASAGMFALMVWPAELYLLAGADMWVTKGSGWVGTILIFMTAIGAMWLREEIAG